MAAIAIRHSNRIEMNTATRARKITSARSALYVISLPHDELTRLTLTSSGLTPAASANLAFISVPTSSGWSAIWTLMKSVAWIGAPGCGHPQC